MFKTRWLLALPLVLAATLSSAQASSIRDDAGLFSAEVVSQARAKLDRIEREYRAPVTIETVETLNGRNIDEVLPEHAREIGAKGLFVLIAKKETKIEVERSGDYATAFPTDRLRKIRAEFIAGLKKNPDAGLKQGVDAVEKEAAAARAETGGVVRRAAPPAGRFNPPGRPAAVPRASFGLGSLVGIGLVILAVLVGIRLLGALMGGNRGGYPGRPGYGGPGYGGGGGGGGGFMSSMFGGIGGALAGNWLYDQFSGRHHGGDNAAYGRLSIRGTPCRPGKQ